MGRSINYFALLEFVLKDIMQMADSAADILINPAKCTRKEKVGGVFPTILDGPPYDVLKR